MLSNVIETPILLIGFNRPDTIKIVFDSIRKVRPKKLYVAIDGHRKQVMGEKELVEEVKHIVYAVDWDCDVKYLFRENNLGCRLGVSGAITWAFENEKKLIIIEDDIVAVPAFFSFAEDLLEKYKNDERIAMISANQYTPIHIIDDYVFTKYGHIWGWATWKRVWDKFDVNIPGLKNDLENGIISEIGLSKKEKFYLEKYAKNILSLISDNSINTWDYQFAFFRLRNQLLSIAPRTNLASNIGVNSSRTDHKSLINEHYYPSDNNFALKNHPSAIECDAIYDKHHFKKHINRKSSLIKRAYRKALRILKHN